MFRRVNTKIFLIAIFILSTLFAVNTFAQDTTGGTNILQQYKAIYNSNTPALENWVRSNTESTVSTAVDAFLGLENAPEEILSGRMVDSNGQPVSWIPNGLLGKVNNITASLFTPQASGIEYIAHLKDNLLGKPVYAQSTGASAQGLLLLLPIWRNFRNVIYILSSVVFVIIGILVILRIKISPQAVVTIQNAVPQLIITLVLVTFSYAIAGLIIDFTNLLQAIFGYLIWPTAFNGSFQQFVANIPIVKDLLIDSATIINPNPATFLELMLIPSIVSSLFGFIIGPALGGIIGAIFGSVPGAVAGASIGTLIVLLVVLIIMAINLIKLLIGLLKVYTTILFKIIIAPLEIGMGAFPGSKMGFDSWLTDLFANLMVFPIVFLFLLILNRIIAVILINGGPFVISQALHGNSNILGGMWAPGILGGGQFGALGPAGGLAVFGIAFAGISILSKLPELIPQLIFNMKNPWGQAIGQATQSQALKTAKSFTGNMVANQFSGKSGTGPLGYLVDRFIPGASEAAADTIRSASR